MIRQKAPKVKRAEVRLTALQVKLGQGSLRHSKSLLPSYTTLGSLARVHASFSLLGRKSAAYERVEVDVFAGFSGAPVELPVDPVSSTNGAVSI